MENKTSKTKSSRLEAAVVYFFHDLDGGKVKIGHTKSIESRQAKIHTDNGNELVLLGTLPGGRREEACLHELFAKERIWRGVKPTEWFRVTEDLLSTVRYLLVSRGMPQTVQQELERRNRCRYGLRGVRVAVRLWGCRPYAVLRSRWNAFSRLVLDLCGADDFPAAVDPQELPPGETHAAVHGLIVSAADVLAVRIPDPASTAQSIPASDCFLLSEWPVVCRCWCNTPDED